MLVNFLSNRSVNIDNISGERKESTSGIPDQLSGPEGWEVIREGHVTSAAKMSRLNLKSSFNFQVSLVYF